MNCLLRRYAVILALLLAWNPILPAQTPPRIDKIVIRNVGPPAASETLIQANIRLKVGDPYVRTSIDEDVRTLYSTGYFYNIRVGEERTPEGGVILTYV
jgi:outer membrane protein insertion porin family